MASTLVGRQAVEAGAEVLVGRPPQLSHHAHPLMDGQLLEFLQARQFLAGKSRPSSQQQPLLRFAVE